MHASISKMLDKHRIYSPQHAIKLFKDCRQNNFAIEMTYKDIFEFNDKNINKKKFFIKNVKQFQVQKGSDSCYVKFEHKENFKKFNILNSPYNPNFISTLPKQLKPKLISKSKLENLLKLVSTIPIEYRGFYSNLKNLVEGCVQEW